MKVRSWTKEEEGEIIRLYVEDNLSSIKIAKKFECCPQTILNIFSRNDVNIILGKTLKLKLDENKIIKMYHEDKIKISEISEKFGCCGDTILRILKKNNISIKSALYTINVDDEKVLEYYSEGKNILDIMKIFRCGENKIVNSLHRQGIKTDSSTRRKYIFAIGKIVSYNKGKPNPIIKMRNIIDNPMKKESTRLKNSQAQKLGISNGSISNPRCHLGKYTQRGVMVGEKSPSFGIKKTKEHREKIGISRMGKKYPNLSIAIKRAFDEGRWVSHNKGKTKEDYEPLMRCSLSQSGDKNHNWNNGSSFLPYSPSFNKELKLKIRERDSFTCQECKRSEIDMIEEGYNKTLRIHHIDYNKDNNNPLNLISLCIWCHMKTNTSREHWQRYFSMMVFIKELFNPRGLTISPTLNVDFKLKNKFS